MKKIKKIYKAQRINMGGLILDQALPIKEIDYLDPYILIHHWKQTFKGGEKQNELGVGPHPHRGFTPVTLIFEGGVYHQDSLGNRSLVEKGGVQWMNSGKGVIHSERPSKKISEYGGLFEIIQFWVNVPAKNKLDNATYHPLDINEIPEIIYDGSLGRISIIVGNFEELKGKIETFSDLLILKIDISFGGKLSIPIPEDFNTLLYQLDGKLKINNNTISDKKELILFEHKGDSIIIEGLEDTRAIILAGKPINEKISSYGPFVMNSQKEIYDAINDYNSGKMGSLTEKFNETIEQT